MAGCGVCGRAFAYEEPTEDCKGCGATVCRDCWRTVGCLACVEFEDGPFFGKLDGDAK